MESTTTQIQIKRQFDEHAPIYIRRICDCLCDQTQISQLLDLYYKSQVKYCRNGKLLQEIGSSREQDLVSYLSKNFGSDCQYNINQCLQEDVVMFGTPISIKHINSITIKANGIKARWTSDAKKQQEFIQNHTFMDMFIVYIDMDPKSHTNTFKFRFLTKAALEETEKNSKTVFKTSEGTNSRGIEYDSKFFKKAMDLCSFQVDITHVKQLLPYDPIASRVHKMKTNQGLTLVESIDQKLAYYLKLKEQAQQQQQQQSYEESVPDLEDLKTSDDYHGSTYGLPLSFQSGSGKPNEVEVDPRQSQEVTTKKTRKPTIICKQCKFKTTVQKKMDTHECTKPDIV